MNYSKTVQGHVKAECEKPNVLYPSAYAYHFIPVVNIGKELAQEIGADTEVVEIACWLHDIGSIHGHKEIHHEYGRDYAQTYLAQLGYAQDKIDLVAHAIHAHRGSQSIARETKEAQCVADADALSHIYGICGLFRLAYVDLKLEDEMQARTFVLDKIARSYAKLSDYARERVHHDYEATVRVLTGIS